MSPSNVKIIFVLLPTGQYHLILLTCRTFWACRWRCHSASPPQLCPISPRRCTDQPVIVTDQGHACKATSLWSLIMRSRSLIIRSRSLIMRSRSLIKRSRSLIIRSRSLIMRSRSLKIRSRSLIMRSRSLIIRSRSLIENVNPRSPLGELPSPLWGSLLGWLCWKSRSAKKRKSI